MPALRDFFAGRRYRDAMSDSDSDGDDRDSRLVRMARSKAAQTEKHATPRYYSNISLRGGAQCRAQRFAEAPSRQDVNTVYRPADTAPRESTTLTAAERLALAKRH